MIKKPEISLISFISLEGKGRKLTYILEYLKIKTKNVISFLLFVILFVDYSLRWLGFTPGPTLRDHSWWGFRRRCDTRDQNEAGRQTGRWEKSPHSPRQYILEMLSNQEKGFGEVTLTLVKKRPKEDWTSYWENL